jgi:penicillin amidase
LLSRLRPIAVNLLVLAISLIVIIVLSSALSALMAIMNPAMGVWSVAREGAPASYEQLSVPGLHGEIRVIFDKLGVPHIYAPSDEDVFFAIGYVHARDRLWQMDIQRRFAEGKLSEVLGKDFVKKDLFMRILGLDRAAKASADTMRDADKAGYALFDAYSRGVNYVIGDFERRAALPLEFKLIGYEPQPWTPEDSLAFARLISWSLTNYFDPVDQSLLVSTLGKADFAQLFPVYSQFQAEFPIVPGNGALADRSLPYTLEEVNAMDWFSQWATGLDFESSTFRDQVVKATTSILSMVLEARDPAGELGLGSNHWTVSPSRSATSHAMLANDPHLSLQMPSLWYEIQLVTPSYMVYGASLAGVPVVLIGRNEHIAWGLTNAGIGVSDFYVEKINPTNPNEYWFQGSWLKMNEIQLEIAVKGESSVKTSIFLTVHGPVLTREGLAVTMRWTGFDQVTEANAILGVDKASSYTEFMNAIRLWAVPPQNFMYADDQGNIAVTVAGKFPTRNVHLSDGTDLKVVGSRSLLNGTGDYEWTDSIPFEDVPHALNPTQGYLTGPNQMSTGSRYPYLILSGWWPPAARAHRINDLIRNTDKPTFEDMQRFQSDIYDYFASLYVPRILKATSEAPPADQTTQKAIQYLRDWDFQMRKDEVAPTIWSYWLSAFYNATTRPVYEGAGLTLSNIIYPTPETLWLLILNDPSSKWFSGDFDRTASVALETAVQALTQKLGSDTSSWSWGKVHVLYIRHLSGLAALSEGPFPEDGDAWTLMAAPHIHSDFTINAYSSAGPSWRIVSDLSTGGSSVGVYPGGQSGNVASAHYSDELPLWQEYEYHVLLHPETAESFPADQTSSTVRMVPS